MTTASRLARLGIHQLGGDRVGGMPVRAGDQAREQRHQQRPAGLVEAAISRKHREYVGRRRWTGEPLVRGRDQPLSLGVEARLGPQGRRQVRRQAFLFL